jgi:tetratricopeptide (TPR) repeat protein
LTTGNQEDDPLDFLDESISRNEQIEAAIQSEHWEDARIAIEELLSAMPADWKPIQRGVGDASTLICSFWDNAEFMSFVANRRQSDGEISVVWSGESYSKRWWQLAFVNRRQGLHRNALTCIERGLELEPDHPHLWIKKGLILSETKQYVQTLTAFESAANVRSWASPSVVAWALRQQGYVLIELGRLNEAQVAYWHSLELDPNCETAAHELEYIGRLIQERDQKAKQLPWFLHCLKFPPEDPVTRELIALVDGMETIAGPKTVGPDNYAQISKAFFELGWKGFEEEFNRLFPPDRPDYVAIKRNLLREPIFLRKVHERMARVFLGESTVEEVLDEANHPEVPPKN